MNLSRNQRQLNDLARVPPDQFGHAFRRAANTQEIRAITANLPVSGASSRQSRDRDGRDSTSTNPANSSGRLG